MTNLVMQPSKMGGGVQGGLTGRGQRDLGLPGVVLPIFLMKCLAILRIRVLVVAKRRPAMVHFTDVFTHHKAKKQYLTLVKGRLPQLKGIIDLPLQEHQQTAASRAQRGINMQEARTRYEVVSQNDECAYIKCVIETGRTHQIRRHFAAIGHPVLGDAKHGDFAFNRDVKARWGLKRLFLHSTHLEFPHPSDQKKIVIDCPLPDDLGDVLTQAGLNRPKKVGALT